MSQSLPPAVILAGGLSRRMGGGDKCLQHLAGRPILSHVMGRFSPQVGALALNANGDPSRFDQFDLTVLADPLPDYPGPLAGVLAAMEWAARSGAPRVVTVSADVPFLPNDLVARLTALGPTACYARSYGREHPTIGVWPVSAAEGLRDYLMARNRRVLRWVQSLDAQPVDFTGNPDPFLNINTPEDLANATRLHAL
ncbi:MAG: molybdenum cofactor guanylyltransferase MobA [Rhodobacteraceae bacterium]|nr:molybdenum cofactor guanylyltransferase MobA [Paracoccaceae bacterium]